MAVDGRAELSLRRPDLGRRGPGTQIEAPVESKPIAESFDALFGLVQTGTAAPMEQRTTRAVMLFEEPKMRAVILDRLRRGYPPKIVLQACRITQPQWRLWQGKAARGLEPYASFVDEVTTAQAEGAIALMDDIRRASEGAPDQHGIWKNNWQAGRYLLEVGDPDTFKLVEKQLSAHVELPAQQVVDVRAMRTEDLRAMVEIAERAPVVDAEFEVTER